MVRPLQLTFKNAFILLPPGAIGERVNSTTEGIRKHFKKNNRNIHKICDEFLHLLPCEQ